jgi:hypothetical protein
MKHFYAIAAGALPALCAASPVEAYVIYESQTLDGGGSTASVNVSYTGAVAGAKLCYRNSFGVYFWSCKAIDINKTGDTVLIDPAMVGPGDYHIIMWSSSDAYMGESVVFHTR